MTLTCTRQNTWLSTYVFWVRIVSGASPDTLGGSLSYDFEKIKQTHHLTAKQEPGQYVLHISRTQFSDSAIYYCLKVTKLNMTFLKGVFLRVKGK